MSSVPPKRRPADLAILGGIPLAQEPVHVGRPNLGDRSAFYRRLDTILDRVWLTNDGPTVREFEDRVAELSGVDHCVATANGTLALLLAVRSLYRLPGEVIVPSFTFIASPATPRWEGYDTRFVDVTPEDHLIDPASTRAALSDDTRGLIAVALWGHLPDSAIVRECSRAGLDVIVDAAHALLSRDAEGRSAAQLARAAIYSFHATKFVNAAEGGAVVTNDAALASELRELRNFGFVGYDQVSRLGINAKLSEIHAALGLCSLEIADALIAVNQERYEMYLAALGAIRNLRLLPHEHAGRERCNFQYIVVEVGAGALSRDEVQEILRHENVLSRRYFYPGCHQHAFLSSLPVPSLPTTDRLTSSVLCLPTGPGVSEDLILGIAQVLELACEHPSMLRTALKGATTDQ